MVSKKKRILLIEDDSDIRNLVTTSIMEHLPNQFIIDQFDNAEFALSSSFRKSYDLLIVDFKLQEMSGLEFINILR